MFSLDLFLKYHLAIVVHLLIYGFPFLAFYQQSTSYFQSITKLNLRDSLF